MKKKLFISTAGVGSRVAGLGIVPNKSLLPINYEPIISKILDKFDKDLEVVTKLPKYNILYDTNKVFRN